MSTSYLQIGPSGEFLQLVSFKFSFLNPLYYILFLLLYFLLQHNAIIISRLYIFTGFLELSMLVFPAVLFSSSSPLFNILLICSIILLLPMPNNSAIKFWISHISLFINITLTLTSLFESLYIKTHNQLFLNLFHPYDILHSVKFSHLKFYLYQYKYILLYFLILIQ